MKVLHILDHYKPHFSGYVFRSSSILKYQQDFGIEPVVLTSPKHGVAEAGIEEIDNLRIYSTSQNSFGTVPFVREARMMKSLQSRIEEVINIEKPDIIHAHSPSLNGIPALIAGRKDRIPVVYEVRALWEDAAVDHRTFKEGSFKYRFSRFIETELMKRVDALFTICEGIRTEIVSRGISPDHVTVIPNCVDLDFFTPEKYSRDIADEFGLENVTVFGYIGSFYHYEGIDLLLDSYEKILKERSQSRLLLVGDGPEMTALQRKASQMGMLSNVIFTGKVAHDQIKKYYSVIDVLVYPRRKMRLTDMVTPLKPLEAMALDKVVVGSDVGGIKELVTHNKDGFLFRAGDIMDLAALLIDLISNREISRDITKTAMDTIKKKHTWELIARRYLPVYRNLIKESR
jgi:PEP-CTERM/exosortase A-associated glycosyltransferase